MKIITHNRLSIFQKLSGDKLVTYFLLNLLSRNKDESNNKIKDLWEQDRILFIMKLIPFVP